MINELNLNTNNIRNGRTGNQNARIDIISPEDVGALDKDAFLKMLLTQLQNQDPLNPMDNTEFASQMAQFSTLEQLSNISTDLQQLGSINLQLNEILNIIKKGETSSGTDEVENDSNKIEDGSDKVEDNTGENSGQDELSKVTIHHDFLYDNNSTAKSDLVNSINKLLINSIYSK